MSAVLEAREPSARYLEAVPPTLVGQFDLLATAQGGAVRLRELIVLLALQGKLVEQDPRDASALDWLATIQAHRDTLSAKGLVKPGKNPPLVEEYERWFDLPATWTWARLNDLVISSEAGWSPCCPETPRRGERWGVIKVSAVSWGKFDPAANKELPDELAPRPEYEVRPGDFLLSRANTAELVARSVVVAEAPPRLMLSDKIIRLTFAEGVNRAFINLCNNSGTARNYYVAKASGTSSSMKNVSREVVLGLPIPVPPVDEQTRIVARVDELMRLCDALEAKGRLEAEQHARLLGTLLGTLTDSSTPEELAANWQRVADHFDLLLDRPEAVDALEQTILQLAVRGLLVQQDPKDEAASDFLQRLHTERRRLGSENKGKREDLRAQIKGGPDELPSGWLWTTIEDLADVGTGTTPSRDNAAFFTGGTIPWVTSGGTGQPFIRTTSQHVTEAALASTSLTLYPVGTLIVAMYGQGKTRGQVSELCLEATTNQACAAVVLLEKSAPHRDFVKLVFEKSYDEIRELSAGGAQPNLNVGKVKASLIPLPPLAEQARIVTRVTELRRFCADLRQRLTASQTTQSQLAEAWVNEVA